MVIAIQCSIKANWNHDQNQTAGLLKRKQLIALQTNISASYAEQLNSTQLNSTQPNSTQLNSTQLNSTQRARKTITHQEALYRLRRDCADRGTFHQKGKRQKPVLTLVVKASD